MRSPATDFLLLTSLFNTFNRYSIGSWWIGRCSSLYHSIRWYYGSQLVVHICNNTTFSSSQLASSPNSLVIEFSIAVFSVGPNLPMSCVAITAGRSLFLSIPSIKNCTVLPLGSWPLLRPWTDGIPYLHFVLDLFFRSMTVVILSLFMALITQPHITQY